MSSSSFSNQSNCSMNSVKLIDQAINGVSDQCRSNSAVLKTLSNRNAFSDNTEHSAKDLSNYNFNQNLINSATVDSTYHEAVSCFSKGESLSCPKSSSLNETSSISLSSELDLLMKNFKMLENQTNFLRQSSAYQPQSQNLELHTRHVQSSQASLSREVSSSPTRHSNFTTPQPSNVKEITEQLVMSITEGNDLFLKRVGEIRSMIDSLFASNNQTKQKSHDFPESKFRNSNATSEEMKSQVAQDRPSFPMNTYDLSQCDSFDSPIINARLNLLRRRNSLPLFSMQRFGPNQESSLNLDARYHNRSLDLAHGNSPVDRKSSFQHQNMISEESLTSSSDEKETCFRHKPLATKSSQRNPIGDIKLSYKHQNCNSSSEHRKIDKGKYFVLSDSYWDQNESSVTDSQSASNINSQMEQMSILNRRNSQDCCSQTSSFRSLMHSNESVEKSRRAALSENFSANLDHIPLSTKSTLGSSLNLVQSNISEDSSGMFTFRK